MAFKFFFGSELHNQAQGSQDVLDKKCTRNTNANVDGKFTLELMGDVQVIKHLKHDRLKQDIECQLSSKPAKILGLRASDLCEDIFNKENGTERESCLKVADAIMKFENISQLQTKQKSKIKKNIKSNQAQKLERKSENFHQNGELSTQPCTSRSLSTRYGPLPAKFNRSKSDVPKSSSTTIPWLSCKEMKYLKCIFKNRSSMFELTGDDTKKSEIIVSRYKTIMGDIQNRRVKQKIAKRMVEFAALNESRFYTDNGQPTRRVRSFTYNQPQSIHQPIQRTLSNPDLHFYERPKEGADLSANNETYIPYTAVGSSEDIHLLNDGDNRQSFKQILDSLERQTSATSPEVRPKPKPRPKPTLKNPETNPEKQIPIPKPRLKNETEMKNEDNEQKTESPTKPAVKPKPSNKVVENEKEDYTSSICAVKDDEVIMTLTPSKSEKFEHSQAELNVETKNYDKPKTTYSQNIVKQTPSPVHKKQNSTKVFNFNDVLPYAIVKLDTEMENKTKQELKSPELPLKETSPSPKSNSISTSEESYLEPVDCLSGNNSPVLDELVNKINPVTTVMNPVEPLSPTGKLKSKRQKFKDKEKNSTISKSYAGMKHKVSIKDELNRRKSLPNYLVPNDGQESEETDIYESVSPYNSDDDVGWDAEEFDSSDEEEFVEIPKMPQLEGVAKKIYHIVTEILTTERAYVKRLNLLENIFHQRILQEATENNSIPPKVVNEIFPNLSPIYTFHSTILLPELEKRIQEWGRKQRIGDIFKTLGHCLLLYTEFVKKFDHANSLLTHWLKKSPKFAAVVEELQQRPECENLTLHHHMLEPIQRVPRYKLLLTDYLKKLPANSEDRAESEASLVIISKAAENANNSMKENEKFKQLLELEDRIQEGLNGESLVTASRVFLKEGELIKLAARKGSKMTRTILLFNDCLMCCLVTATGKLRVRQIMDMTGLTIDDDDPSLPENSFRIKSTQRILDLIAKNEEEKDTWISSIRCAVDELHEKRGTTIQRMLAEDEKNKNINVGQNAPLWVKDEDVTMCMLCALKFGLVHRKHHCRGCGRVVCDKCSGHRAKLAYAGNSIQRVCYACSKKLGHKVEDQQEKLPKSVLTRDSTACSDMSGEVYWKAPGKGWSKEWIVLSDFVLYIQKKKQDVKAHTQIPVPGFEVCDPSSADEIDSAHPHCLKIHKGSKKDLTYFISSENGEAVKNWRKHLELAVTLQKIADMKDGHDE